MPNARERESQRNTDRTHCDIGLFLWEKQESPGGLLETGLRRYVTQPVFRDNEVGGLETVLSDKIRALSKLSEGEREKERERER